MASKRQIDIHNKGFNMNEVTSYKSTKINGVQKINNANVNLKTVVSKVDSYYTDKSTIIEALTNNEVKTLRTASEFYFNYSGIYKRACEYLAYLYRYDYYLTTYRLDDNEKSIPKILDDFHNFSMFLENSNLKKKFNEIALEVVKKGCYYGYRVDSPNKIILQDLPQDYCRSRFTVNDRPAIEFNMKYFDDNFRDSAYKEKVLNLFPPEFKKGYDLYQKSKLKPDVSGDENSWYLLDINHAVKFNFNGVDIPYLAASIPAILDLEEAQELDKKIMMQQLMKILIQKLPVDKNGDLIFDVDEAKDLHMNATAMLSNILGVDVLTTFADIDVEDVGHHETITAKADSLTKVERGVFNALGMSNNLFNTDGNTALEKSILNDEAVAKTLVYQFQDFLNDILMWMAKNPKKWYFKVKILETTIYNYRELSKLYKEQVQYGYSKFLPQIALGHNQNEILAELDFENNVLDLSSIMVPAQSSATMSSKQEDKTDKSESNNNQKIVEEKESGRKELSDDEKSDKTLQNLEAES